MFGYRSKKDLKKDIAFFEESFDEVQEILELSCDIVEGLTEQNIKMKLDISLLNKELAEANESVRQYQVIIQYQDFYISQLEGRVTLN
jgi:hypothetical protein